jgi:hypothetical protein
MPKLIQTQMLTGQRFGSLSPLYPCCRITKNGDRSITQWVCLCDCGTSVVRNRDSLIGGKAISCGCKKGELNTTHGMTPKGKPLPKIYRAWLLMKNRCFNGKSKDYKYYGGRGIKVCDRWVSSFQNFYEDMGDPPSPQMTLDRINSNGDYSPSNCRWATRLTQSRNRRSTKMISYDGILISLPEFCEKYGLKYDSTKTALNRGKTPEQIIERRKNA